MRDMHMKSAYNPNNCQVGLLYDMKHNIEKPNNSHNTTVYCSCWYCHTLMRRKKFGKHKIKCKFIKRKRPRDSYIVNIYGKC